MDRGPVRVGQGLDWWVANGGRQAVPVLEDLKVAGQLKASYILTGRGDTISMEEGPLDEMEGRLLQP